MLFGTREGDVRVFEPGELPSSRLTGLNLEAVIRLLRDQPGDDVSQEVGAELLASTGGTRWA